jgi:hypothetical protein
MNIQPFIDRIHSHVSASVVVDQFELTFNDRVFVALLNGGLTLLKTQLSSVS